MCSHSCFSGVAHQPCPLVGGVWVSRHRNMITRKEISKSPIFHEKINNQTEENRLRDIHQRGHPFCRGHICKADERNKVTLCCQMFWIKEIAGMWRLQRPPLFPWLQSCRHTHICVFQEDVCWDKVASFRPTSSFEAGAKKQGGCFVEVLMELSWTPCCECK